VNYELPDEMRIQAEGPVRTVTIDRPDELNAVNAGLHWALANVWRQIAADQDAKVVILTGAGRTFCAGGDFGWLMGNLEDPAAQNESLREGAQIIEEMVRFPLPVIAAVNGPAVGLGCSVAVLCDIVLMSTAAHLADPHIAVGLVAGDGGAAIWPLLTMMLRTKEYLYTGDRIGAETAVELGLATRTVEPDQLMLEARNLAERLARQPALALQSTKRVLNLHLGRALGEAVPAGFAAEAETMESSDYRRRITDLATKGAR
jgi:enoyl-CoA hydratase